jgi:hypothetical protein
VILLALAWVPALSRAQTAPPAFAGEPVAQAAGFDVAPESARRVGFDLGLETARHRVAVSFAAFVPAERSTGYSQPLALEVNGEVMGLLLSGRPRLLNRPMEFRFAPHGSRQQVSGVPGVCSPQKPPEIKTPISRSLKEDRGHEASTSNHRA